MMWKVPRMWEGGDVWIIGGGPSIPQQFDVPEEIIQKVINGTLPPSAFSPYMEAIHKKHVIGVNMAYRLGNWIDMVVFGDSGFFLREKVGLSQFPGLKVSCNTNKGDPWLKCLGRDNNHPKGISTLPTLVSWNSNTGAAAISIAVHAGAKRVILLGFDMNIDNTKMQHWHNLYGKGPVNDDRRRRKLPFSRHLTGFPVIAEDAKRVGVEIINASPSSAIDCFPKVSVKEFLNS
jgi:hypothetical protein